MPRGIKRLGYRVQGAATQQGQAAHWAGFTFQGGPWQVIYRGPWGSWQVWASSEAEGRRVIAHACAAAGVSPTDPEGAYSVNLSTSARHQRVATYRTALKFGLPVVTVRSGPSGPPLIGL
jgi:hypothetical protein